MTRARRCSALWHTILVGLLLACATTSAQPSESPSGDPRAPKPLIQRTTHGDIQVRLEADRHTMRITDSLQLHVSVHTLPDTVVAFPHPAETLGPFRIVQHELREPRAIAPDTQAWQQDYTLEATRAGSLTIPPLTITLQAKDASEPRTIQTRPLTLTVTSVLPENADPMAPKDIAPPVALTRRGLPLWLTILLGIVALLCLLAALWWWYRRRTRPAEAPPPRPAHLVALEALRQLQHDNLITMGRIDEFYVRLSAIVRRYVEWRFGLRAPEQTTEEFLAVAHTTGDIIGAHRDLLGAFLQQCDLVKFARHQPTSDDMQRVWDSAKTFVEHTADEQVRVAVTGADV